MKTIKIIKIISNLLIGNFFLIYLIAQLFVLSRGWDPPLPQMIFVFNAFYGICLLSRIKHFITLDYIVLIYIFYIIFNGLLSDYPNKEILFQKALTIQVSCVFLYFVGRSKSFDIVVLNNNRWPLIITSILGIYFFFRMPGWYLDMKNSMIKGDTTYMSLGETMRLSAFWAHPYYFVYGLMSVVPFVLLDMFKKNKHNGFVYAELLIISIALILAQLRVAIACFILFVLCNFYSNSKNKATFIIYTIFVFMLVTLIVGFIIFSYLDADSIRYIFEHSSGLEIDSRYKATSGGHSMDSFWGGGFGRYSLKVGNSFAIIDNEYQKLLAEIGILGFSIVIIIFLLSLVRITKIKEHYVEKMIVLFYIIACLGASCLSNISQYPFIFWLALGSLWSDKTDNRWSKYKVYNLKKIKINES